MLDERTAKYRTVKPVQRTVDLMEDAEETEEEDEGYSDAWVVIRLTFKDMGLNVPAALQKGFLYFGREDRKELVGEDDVWRLPNEEVLGSWVIVEKDLSMMLFQC